MINLPFARLNFSSLDFDMKISKDSLADPEANRIYGYASGSVRINDKTVTHSVIVTPRDILAWPPREFDDISGPHFDPIEALQPEIVLLGTGADTHFPDLEIIARFTRAGIGFEVMDTGAACRTFNILMAEDRHVVAALLMS